MEILLVILVILAICALLPLAWPVLRWLLTWLFLLVFVAVVIGLLIWGGVALYAHLGTLNAAGMADEAMFVVVLALAFFLHLYTPRSKRKPKADRP